MNHKTFTSDGGGSSIDWWHVLITVTAHFLEKNKTRVSCFLVGRHPASNSFSIDTAALIAVMRLVCLNGFNTRMFACQNLKRESSSLMHVPGFPQPPGCWRTWCMCANNSVSLIDVCCYVLFLSKITCLVFSFLSGNAKFCISGYGGECKTCILSPTSRSFFLSYTCSCFSHEATACIMFHGYSF